MKKSGYRTTFHIYFLFFLTLLGIVTISCGLFFMVITARKSDGSFVKSNWPVRFTENFKKEIIFEGGKPHINESAMEELEKEDIGLQILDDQGNELYSYKRTSEMNSSYSNTELLQLYRNGSLKDKKSTSFIGEISYKGSDYLYILHFPMKITKTTMYLSGESFTQGKSVILIFMITFLVVIILAGIIYGFRTTRTMDRLSKAIEDISKRSYLPVYKQGAFNDIYKSLNELDGEIKVSDKLQKETETLRKEWIANITHDLKTPLSPIKGYAEILSEEGPKTEEQCRRYSKIMVKNVSYMETLINDLKLTYQLDGGMVPFNPEEKNIVRFLKEVVIDILNNPEYEQRCIDFNSSSEEIPVSFDNTLLTRAFNNLIINAFVHGDKNTEVEINISTIENSVKITVGDNGKGMTQAEEEKLFDRYYRGMDTKQKPEGTGLGLAITKGIIELHRGNISVSSVINSGTVFEIILPCLKDN